MAAKSKGQAKVVLNGTLVGENVAMRTEGQKLIVEIDLGHRGKISEKGNARVCSTLGNATVPCDGAPSGMKLGINGYVGT